MKLIKWFKELLFIVRNYRGLCDQINHLDARVKDLTTVNLDVHQHCGSNVVLVGRYRNHDYVEIHTMSDHEFNDIVEMLVHYRKQGRVHRIDVAPQMKAVFEREKY